MQSRYQRFYQFLALFGDILLLNAAFFISLALRFDEIHLEDTAYYDYYVQLFVFFNLLWLLLSLVLGNVRAGIALAPRRSAAKTFQVIFFHLFVLLLLLVSLKRDEFSRLFLIYFYLIAGVGVLVWRYAFVFLVRRWRAGGRGATRLLLIAPDALYREWDKMLQNHPEYGLRLAAHCTPDEARHSGLNSLLNQAIDEVLCSLPPDDSQAQLLFAQSESKGVRFKFLTQWHLPQAQPWYMEFYGAMPVLSLRSEPLQHWHNHALKRLCDVLLASLVLLIIFPLTFPLLAIGIKLSGPGSLFFSQVRTGYRNRNFTLYKYRSMHSPRQNATGQAQDQEERITPFGKFLRRSHLDELPQFWNVLRGDMAVVGPRPHMLEHTDQYRSLIHRYLVRHWVKPGLTGLAQVRGLHGYHTPATMEARVQADVYYLENWSLLLDLSIMGQTVLMLMGIKNPAKPETSGS